MKITQFIPAFLLFFCLHYASAQENLSDCSEDIHGDGHVHIDCDDDIIITSTSEEVTGSVIYGLITTDENHSIKVLPGYNSVRIIAEIPDPDGKTHRTKMGGNNGGGGNRESLDNTDVNTIVVSPNPVVSYTSILSKNSKLINIKIYDIRGQLLDDLKFAPQLKLNLNAKKLNKGIFFLKIQLEDGGVINKSIIKE